MFTYVDLAPEVECFDVVKVRGRFKGVVVPVQLS